MARKQTTTAPETIQETTTAPETIQETTIAPETIQETTIAPETIQETTIAPETIQETTIAPETIQETAIAPETAHELIKTVDGLALDMGYKLSNAALIHVRASAFGIVAANQGDLAALKAQADGLKQKVNREIGIALAALPAKLDKATYDGFSSPMQFAEKVLGYSHTAAADIVATGRIYADDNAPEALRNMPISNLAELLRADYNDALKAVAAGEIKADTPQSEITAFKQSHPKATKTGKAKLVAILTDMLTHTEGTEDELKAAISGEGIELFKAKGYTLHPADAPEKALNVRVYVRLWYDGVTGAPMTEVHTLVPKYTPEVPKPTPEQLSKAAARETMIISTMNAKALSREAATELLLDLGLIEAE